jgi:[ribosomal protein S5]-alanine N-acetyltransferase
VPYPVTLTGSRITMREFRPDDLEALHRLYSDPVTTEHLSFEPRSHAQTEAILARVIDAATQEPRTDYSLAICLGDTDGPMIGFGRIALGQPDPGGPQRGLDAASDAGQLGLAIHADHWRQGYGREATILRINFAFDLLNLSRVWGARGPLNARSKALMESVGLREDYTIANHITKYGQPRDSVVHTLDRANWSDARRG